MISFDEFTSMGSEEQAAQVSSVKAENDDFAKALQEACKAYFSDQDATLSSISSRLREIVAEKDALDAELEKMKPKLVRATAAGNREQISVLENRIYNLTAKQNVLAKQIEMLESAAFPVNEELYNAVLSAKDAFVENASEMRKLFSQIVDYADQQKRYFEKLQEKASTKYMPEPDVQLKEKHGKLSDFQRVLNDFTAHSTVAEKISAKRL